ncbi:hypothetical protein ABW20_dc0107818 [Dactylellina cionopaga]|nr:hypothetical protein ABW20_dc0107818 [Dactylellina cionopaga]
MANLPTEILTMIFEYALPWFSNPATDESGLFQDRLKEGNPLTKVCRRWRYLVLPKILRSVTISECTFLTKSAHCHNCRTSANKHLVSVPVVRSLFDGTATLEATQLADHIRTVALSPVPCERRSANGEDSLESGFVFFLPRVETVVLPSNLVRNFLNGSSAHGLSLALKPLPSVRIYNSTSSIGSPYRRRATFSSSNDLDEFSTSWIIPEDIKKLEVDGDCLRMFEKMPLVLLEELTVNRRSYGDKFIQPPPIVSLITLLSNYNAEFSTLSKVTIRWLPKSDQSFPALGGSTSKDACLCSTLASIISLEHLDTSTICPLFFAKKLGKCVTSVAFEYPCVHSRARPPPPTKHQDLRALVGPAMEMRNRLIPEATEPSRVSTLISLLSTKSRDKPHLIESSLTTPPAYTLDLSRKVVRVTEYSAKAATRYRLYINSLVARSTKAIVAREDKKLLSEYAIAARSKSLTDSWHCSWTGPSTTKKQRTTVLRWDYDVDMDVFFGGATAGEFMVLGRQKDRLLNAREAEERKAKKAEMEKLKSVTPPKKRSRKRKQDTADPVQTTTPIAESPSKRQKSSQGVVLPPISSLLATTSIKTTSTNVFQGYTMWA